MAMGSQSLWGPALQHHTRTCADEHTVLREAENSLPNVCCQKVLLCLNQTIPRERVGSDRLKFRAPKMKITHFSKLSAVSRQLSDWGTASVQSEMTSIWHHCALMYAAA